MYYRRSCLLDKNIFLFFLLLFLTNNAFSMIDTSKKIVVISFSDFVFLYCAAYIVYYYSRYRVDYIQGYFSWMVVLVPVIIVINSCAAYINYGQSVKSGILTQRYWLVAIMTYFPLHSQIIRKKITYEQIVRLLYGITIVYIILCDVQYLIGIEHRFMFMQYSYRYGDLRLHSALGTAGIILPIALFNILKGKNRVFNTCVLALVFHHVLVVNKTRSILLSHLFILALVIVLSDVKKRYKVVTIIIGALAALYYLKDSTILTDIIEILFYQKQDATFNVRVDGHTFYRETMRANKLSYLFGFGYPNTSKQASLAATGYTRGYLLADNGIYGFLFCYGAMGLIWYLYYMVKRFKLSWKTWKEIGDPTFLVLTIQSIAFFANDTSYYYAMAPVMTIFKLILNEARALEQE